MSSILDRLHSLRAKAEEHDPSPRSEIRTPTPLATFLLIYSRATHDCYINYNEGAKALHEWLSPISYPVEKHPDIDNPAFKVPYLLRGYASAELCRVLAGERSAYDSFDLYMAAVARTERAVYLTMAHEVVYDTY
jgi:hypothetical protein